MAKKPTRKNIIKKLDTIFSIYIRRRFAKNEIAECFTCNKKAHWKELQCGHFQSRKHYATRWDETNCQVQCSGCNVFKYGEQYIFGKRLDSKYGEGTAEKLHIKARKTVKLSTEDLFSLINHFQHLTNTLK
tara:strand:- start:524 stop:916 length:393 start_codon:yes stop_codon:yes gene_type:complete